MLNLDWEKKKKKIYLQQKKSHKRKHMLNHRKVIKNTIFVKEQEKSKVRENKHD